FKALELGALDFIAKPSRQITPELRGIAEELAGKVRLVTQLRVVSLTERSSKSTVTGSHPLLNPMGEPPQATCPVGPAPRTLVAIGSSTGGPPALQQLLVAVDGSSGAGFVISQHMPAKFTRAFAERLGRTAKVRVREAE